MSTFSRKPLKPSPILTKIRAKPFLLFGIPFLVLTVGSSFVMTTFTQTRYDLHNTKHKQLSFDDDLGLTGKRKKVDLREEYFRLSNPGDVAQLDADALSANPEQDDPGPPSASQSKRKKKRLSMVPVSQDDFENVRVPRPEGMPEWGAPGQTSEDAPLKGRRKEDRWV